MNRRALLLTAGGVAASLAGCLGTATSPNDATDDDATTTPTGTPRPLPCPDPDETGEVEIPPWPAFPETLSQGSANVYAREFERVYTTREAAANEEYPVQISVSVGGVDEVRRTGDGWLVQFEVVGPAIRYRPDPESTETWHSDPPAYGVSYFVGEERTLRATSLDPVDPRDAAVESAVVTCTPE